MKPTAAPARFPYVEHRNMAEVMRDERLAEHQRKQVGRLCFVIPKGRRRAG